MPGSGPVRGRHPPRRRALRRLAIDEPGRPRFRTEAIKTSGKLTTDDGEIAVNWALQVRGILMRVEWALEQHLRNGRLVQVLPQYSTPDADIPAVYPQRH